MPQFNEEHPLSAIERSVLVVLATVIVFTPAALGTVQPWSEQVFIALSAAATLLTAIGIARSREGAVIGKWTFVPLAAFPLLIALQLAPWPAFTETLSPAAIAVRKELAVPFAGVGVIDAARISLYPYETARHLRLLVAVVGVFVSAAWVCRNRTAVILLLRIVAGAGLFIALIAAGHVIFDVEKIYGLITRPSRAGETSAPFINRSHFAQFMNAALGASLALVLLAVYEKAREFSPRGWRNWWELFREGQLHGAVLPAMAAGVCALSVLSSASRGGILAMVVASIVAAVAASKRRAARRVAVGFALLMVTATVGALVISDTLREKLRLFDGAGASGGRWELLLSQIPIWREFYVAGVGFGTFEYVFPRYDLSTAYNISSHAENEYAQALTETGAVGLLIVVWFLWLIWLAAIRAVHFGGTRGVMAAGLLVSLTAATLHSALDFGQRLPANAAATAVIAAVLLRLGPAWLVRGERSVNQRFPISQFAWTTVCAVALCALIYPADLHRRSQSALTASVTTLDKLAASNWQGTQNQYDTMISNARLAVALSPSNARAQYQLGAALFWNWMRDRAARFDEKADEQAVNESLAAFHHAVVEAPLFGMPYSMAGQLWMTRGDVRKADELLKVAAELSPQDGWTLILAGEASLRRKDDVKALEQFRRATASSYVGGEFIVRRLIEQFDRADLALKLAGDSTSMLSEIVGLLERRGREQEANQARERLFDAVIKAAEQPSASAGALAVAAEMLAKTDRQSAAVDLYRRALSLEPAQHAWRLALARVLFRMRNHTEAESELRIIVRDNPEFIEARQLAAEVRLAATTQPR